MKSLSNYHTSKGTVYAVENFEVKVGDSIEIDGTEFVVKGIERFQVQNQDGRRIGILV